MQFIFNEDSNLYGYAEQEGESFAFPSNIRQMGCMEDGIRIYVEDYVYTYLYQYAKAGNSKEKLAALAGRAMVIDGQEVIIISGAIQAKDTAINHGVLSFTEKTWEYINNQMEVYFKGQSLVGWVHTQPGFGAFLMAQDELFHKEFFPLAHQVLFAIDPMEKLDAFFIHNEEKTGLRAAKGYFVYYEKNKEMQDYMLDHNLGRSKITPNEKQVLYEVDEKKATPPENLDIISKYEVENSENIEEGAKNNKDIMVSAIRKEGISRRKPSQEERMDAAKDIRRVLQNRAKEADAQSKTKVTILTGVSGVLCLTCLLMGGSMLSNIDRLKKIETEIATVQHSYVAMAQKLESERAQVVFASQNATATPKSEATISLPPTAEAEEAVLKQEAVNKEAVSVEAVNEAPEVKIMDNYMVEEGDNLGRISLVFYGSQKRMGDIMELNNITDANSIKIGQILKIPE